MNKLNLSELGKSLAESNAETELKPPAMYQILLINDDYTPMEFVIDVLHRFFAMNAERATEVMLKVHYEGKAICGIYTSEVAETKVHQVKQYAQSNEYPLLCLLEKI